MGGKSSTISTSEQRILSLQVQQSSQGLTLPVVYGRARVAGNLVWYGDFTTYEHKTTTRQGGKGGGGVKQEDVKYTYEAAVMMALCEGEIKGVTRIWRDKEKFSSPASLRLTLYKGGEEQPVWPHLQQAKHTAQAISYSGTAYLCSPNYELTKSAQIYSHNFEVDGKLGYSTSIVDANPRDIIRDLLTNQKYGCGFPVENLGDTDVYGTYCRAAGIFLSPVYSEQQEAQRNIAELLEQTNSAAVFSQGRLKIVPYGDSGLDKTPVRITEIEEDEDGVLNVKAEDFPFGTASATEYPAQPSLGYSADYNVSPGNAHAPVMFEAPLQLTGGEPEIWLATAGGDMWGGAEVWVSTTGDSYTRVGAVSGKARYGSLTAALPAGAVFDRANTLGVEIGAGQLTGGTEQDSRDLLTLCYADGEFLAYETAELKGVGRYTLGNLTRGAYGSNIDRHEAGRPFVRVDESLFKYPVPRDWIGRTVWVKLVSHNVFGSGAQDLAEVPAYSYRIVGAPLGQVANLRLTSSWAYGREAVLAWDKLDGADTYDVEIYAAGSQTRLRAINGITANGYTYTLADMKADGGQVRNVVFKVRGRAVTGKTGAWAQAVAQNPQLKALTGIQIDSGLRQAFFQCERPSEEDFAGIILWVSDNPACPTVDANRVYDGAETFVTIAKCNGNPLEGGKTYYVRAAGYDSFDKAGLQVSSSSAFTVYDVDVTVRDLAESSLNKALRDKIALIDGNGAGSVNARIATEARERAVVKRETEVLNNRLGSTESSINSLRETVNQKDSSRASEINQLSAKLNNLSVGGRNLIRDSATQVQNSNYLMQSYLMTDNSLQEGEPVTVTIWGDLGSDREAFWPFNSNGWNWLGTMKKVSDGVYRLSTTWQRSKNNPSNDRLLIYCGPNSGRTASRIDRIKLERGTVATDWTPAPEDNSGLQEVRSTVQVVQTALTKATGDIRAVTERITTLQTSVNGNTASIQTHARSINGLEAQYTVKVDVNGRVAGYGLATTPKNGTPESRFIVNADRFGVGAVGKADIFPFTVDTQKNRVGVNGELVVNGKAIIDNLNAGTIHGDKIAANTLNANRIRAGSVTARELGVDKLSAISADMGNISGGSLNLGGGRFTVDNNGRVSMSAASGKVGMKMTNDGIEVYDENGVLRVRLGKLS